MKTNDEIRDLIMQEYYKKRDDKIFNAIANVLCAEGYVVYKEDVKEIFEKALAYDELGEMQELISFKGVYTKHGKRYKELENELNHIKNTLRELLGEKE